MPKGIPKNGVNKGWFNKGQKPWNEIKLKNKSCAGCEKQFMLNFKKQLYCSRGCVAKNIKNSGRFKKGISSWNKDTPYGTGHIVSKETKEKIRASLLGRKRPEFRGKKHPRWKGGGSLGYRIKCLPQYKQWREFILKKYSDCELCEQKNNLEVHHIYPFRLLINENGIKSVNEAKKIDALWDINNGVVLCNKCHNIIESRIIWITGNSCSGKTTLAKKILKFNKRIWLDGDGMRKILNIKGFSKIDRCENNIRIAELTRIFRKQKQNVIVSVICPYEKLRKQVKKITGCKFIYLPGGKIGKKYPYEIPKNPDLIL